MLQNRTRDLTEPNYNDRVYDGGETVARDLLTVMEIGRVTGAGVLVTLASPPSSGLAAANEGMTGINQPATRPEV
ncbi:hypothetical protein J6590_052495 [Homalodisca vitripennis]|nr:hypothetical protein J6590_052495 [Homalodisca vitripennis]